MGSYWEYCDKRDPRTEMRTYDWIKYFDQLFSTNAEGELTYETQVFGPQYREELGKGFIKEDHKEIIKRS
jgi:hypothetical protein